MEFEVELSVYENGRKAPQYTLDTDLNGEITLAELLNFTKAALIIISDETLKEEQANGFDKKPVVVVDGKQNKPVINVSPLGQIEFVSRTNMDEIILQTYTGLLERSPVDTRRYIKSHYVFLNGTQVATDFPSLKSWLATKPQFKDTDFIRFVNIQPYARKLERLGVTAQRAHVRQEKSKDKRGRSGTHILAPNGAYFLTSRSIRRLFKQNSVIKFGFISGSQLGLLAAFKTQASGARGGKRGKIHKGARTYLYPSITISVSQGGIL